MNVLIIMVFITTSGADSFIFHIAYNVFGERYLPWRFHHIITIIIIIIVTIRTEISVLNTSNISSRLGRISPALFGPQQAVRHSNGSKLGYAVFGLITRRTVCSGADVT